MSLFINQKAKLQKMENVKEHVQEKCEEYFARLRSGRKIVVERWHTEMKRYKCTCYDNYIIIINFIIIIINFIYHYIAVTRSRKTK